MPSPFTVVTGPPTKAEIEVSSVLPLTTWNSTLEVALSESVALTGPDSPAPENVTVCRPVACVFSVKPPLAQLATVMPAADTTSDPSPSPAE